MAESAGRVRHGSELCHLSTSPHEVGTGDMVPLQGCGRDKGWCSSSERDGRASMREPSPEDAEERAACGSPRARTSVGVFKDPELWPVPSQHDPECPGCVSIPMA